MYVVDSTWLVWPDFASVLIITTGQVLYQVLAEIAHHIIYTQAAF